jgi:hypothetical protein
MPPAITTHGDQRAAQLAYFAVYEFNHFVPPHYALGNTTSARNPDEIRSLLA